MDASSSPLSFATYTTSQRALALERKKLARSQNARPTSCRERAFYKIENLTAEDKTHTSFEGSLIDWNRIVIGAMCDYQLLEPLMTLNETDTENPKLTLISAIRPSPGYRQET